MILLRHWKVIIGLMAIFCTGVGTGGVGVILLAKHVSSTPVLTHRWVDDRMKELDRELKLTPQQKENIRPIIQTAAERFRAIGAGAFENVVATAEQAHEDVAKELTPEQQVQFKKFRQRAINSLRELMHREINT